MREAPTARPLACLLYHEIVPPGGTGYFGVSAPQFRTQLDRLAALGLRGSSLEGALAAPDRAVAITFDDGDASHSSTAWPELARRGMTATFFVTTDWVGKPGRMSWQELREMARAGMSVQSHTASHPFLSELTAVAVRHELVESKRRLDELLEQDTTTLALPGGDFPRAWEAADFLACGYRCVATSRWGPNRVSAAARAEPFLVRRYTVRRATTLGRFDNLLLGRSAAFGAEGTRLWLLNRIRAALGARRYAAWRRWVLGRARSAGGGTPAARSDGREDLDGTGHALDPTLDLRARRGER